MNLAGAARINGVAATKQRPLILNRPPLVRATFQSRSRSSLWCDSAWFRSPDFGWAQRARYLEPSHSRGNLGVRLDLWLDL